MPQNFKWPLVCLTLLWAFGSWYVYTCPIKGFCQKAEIPTPEVVVETPEPEIELVPVINEPEPEAEAEPVVQKDCAPYLNGFLRFGSRDNRYSEAVRLEEFLRKYRNEEVPVDGYYGRDDEAAIKRLQIEYRADVLDPWGLTYATGNTQKTTRAKINELYCAAQN